MEIEIYCWWLDFFYYHGDRDDDENQWNFISSKKNTHSGSCGWLHRLGVPSWVQGWAEGRNHHHHHHHHHFHHHYEQEHCSRHDLLSRLSALQLHMTSKRKSHWRSASPPHCQSNQVLQLEGSRWTEIQPGLTTARSRPAVITVEDNPCFPQTGNDDNGSSGRNFLWQFLDSWLVNLLWVSRLVSTLHGATFVINIRNCECCPGHYLIVNHYSSI